MRILTRAEWGAKPWNGQPYSVPMAERTHFLVHYHGGKPAASTGVWVPRNVEAIHIANGWSGVGYNFLVDQAGTIYEGRGWGLVGAHCPGRNRDGIGVYVAVGDAQEPTEAAKRAVVWLRAEAERRAGRRLITGVHGDWYPTSCAGPKLTPWVHAGMPTSGKAPGGAPTSKPADTRTELERLLDDMDYDKLLKDLGDVVQGRAYLAAAEAIDDSGDDLLAAATEGANRALATPAIRGREDEWGITSRDLIARIMYRTNHIAAQLSGMTAAVEALAKAQGADPAVIREAARQGTADALGSLEAEVELTIKRQEN